MFEDPHNGPRPPSPDGLWPRWSSARLAATALLLAFANLVVQILAFAWTGDMFAAAGAGGAAVLAMTALSSRLAGGRLWTDFDLDRPAPGILTLSVLAAFAALLPTAALASLSYGIRPPPAQWIAMYNEQFPDTPLRVAAAVTAVTIFAPLAEELVFRGLVFRLTARVWGFLPAAIVSALIFGLVHIEPWYLFGLVGLGLLLAYVYEHTRSLTACIVLHAVHNGISLALMFQQGGMVDSESADTPIPWPFLVASTTALVAVMWLIHRRGARRL